MKKFFAVLAAACLVLSMASCQQNDDVSTGEEQTSAVSNNTILPKVKEEETETEPETTTAPQEAELDIETLAEGEERDYNIEDILKNDLEIDGILISIPCTLNELLEALGDNYSVDKSEIEDEFDGEANTKSKYFIGDFLSLHLYCNNEKTYSYVYVISDINNIDYDTINVIGYLGGTQNGILDLLDLTTGDSLDKCLKNYGKPNKVNTQNGVSYLTYEDDGSFIQINIKNNIIDGISMVGFRTEDLED